MYYSTQLPGEYLRARPYRPKCFLHGRGTSPIARSVAVTNAPAEFSLILKDGSLVKVFVNELFEAPSVHCQIPAQISLPVGDRRGRHLGVQRFEEFRLADVNVRLCIRPVP